MIDLKSSDFEYYLLPGKAPVVGLDINLHNELFAFWREFWTETILEVTGERRKLNTDDFVRQDCFAALKHGGKIVGIHSYSFFNITADASLDHSYFQKYFSNSFVTALFNRNVSSVMTMEYFSVAKEWRGAKTKVSLAKLLVAMGLRLAAQRQVDGTITAARADVPAAKIASSLGALPLVDPIEVHGKPTELMLFPVDAVREPDDLVFKSWINDLWARRIDYLMIEQEHSYKISA